METGGRKPRVSAARKPGCGRPQTPATITLRSQVEQIYTPIHPVFFPDVCRYHKEGPKSLHSLLNVRSARALFPALSPVPENEARALARDPSIIP